jgi:putative membrane protein
MGWGRAIPYCGLPPQPSELIVRWNLDPVLIASLGLAWAAYTYAAKRLEWPRQSAFHLGWAFTGLLLVSPICSLTVSLFSARIGQHMLLAMVAAPLVALGLPRARSGGLGTNPIAAAIVFSTALAYWHAPGPYELTFLSTLVYWLMHLSLYGSALWLWRSLFAHDLRVAPGAGGIGLASASMALIGAILTFAPQPLFGRHLLTTYAWGLTPLEDQQLGGILMWIPGGVLMAAGIVIGLARLMARTGRAHFVQVHT